MDIIGAVRLLIYFLTAGVCHPFNHSIAFMIVFEMKLYSNAGTNEFVLNGYAFFITCQGLVLLRFLVLAVLNAGSAKAPLGTLFAAFLKNHRWMLPFGLFYIVLSGPLEGNVMGFIFLPWMLFSGSVTGLIIGIRNLLLLKRLKPHGT